LPAVDNIRYLRRADIDVALWNACIEGAPNGLPYALTSFLDAACPQWSALVQDNYTAVMPLPQRKKWGINYLYQPFLTPMLGVFSLAEETIVADAFLKAIPARYRLWDLSFNAANSVLAYSNHTIARTNYLLPLQTNYEQIKRGYHQNTRRNLQKALNANLVVKEAIPPSEIIAVAAQQYPLFTKVADRDFDRVQQICDSLTNNIRTYAVYNTEGSLIAACVLLLFRGRVIYWLPANSPKSRTCGASHFLMDHIIQTFGGQHVTLDFEGSDDVGVARFYQQFGAVPEHYISLYYNRLPFPLSLAKRLPAHYRQLFFSNAQKSRL
jgi:hypothetical protein